MTAGLPVTFAKEDWDDFCGLSGANKSSGALDESSMQMLVAGTACIWIVVRLLSAPVCKSEALNNSCYWMAGKRLQCSGSPATRLN